MAQPSKTPVSNNGLKRVPEEKVDLYDSAYSHYGSTAEAAVRADAYGEDIGQSSWITATEWLNFALQLGIDSNSNVLEVGCGSGGPAVYLSERVGCHITGIDINDHGIANARALSDRRHLSARVRFERVDASQPLPFPASSFDAVISNDAMCHIANRGSVLADWYRLLRPGGRMLFTDAMIVTGLVSAEELAIRSSIGFYLFLPPGVNEQLIREAGFHLAQVNNLTDSAANVAKRWHAARDRHRSELLAHEGEANFEGLQRFLSCVHRLSVEGRLSRYSYLASKPSEASS